MTPQELLRETAALFRAAAIPDPEVDGALLLAHLTGRPMLMLRLDGDTQLTEDVLNTFLALREKRLNRMPLQYLTHEQCFLGRDFYVDERVLIPRPETELLVERAVNALRACEAEHPAALDLCCGSGCIAVSMALEAPHAQVDAADLSEGALAVARRNAEALGADIALHQGDLFAGVGDRRYHVIVSNPPYIPTQDCKTLQPEVMLEPGMALDGGADGLSFYRRIAQEAPAHLHEGGVVLLEVGYDQGERVAQLMRDAGFRHAEAYPDFQHILRMVEARL